jgi:hypothetical protein
MARMTHRCENCPRATELYYCRSVDAYLCEDCADAADDAAAVDDAADG